MRKILLVTRPIVPPWDEASKNFAYNLAMNLPDFKIGLLTHGKMENMPENIVQYPIYTSGKLTWAQRARLLKVAKIRKNFDILHFMLTPSRLNALGFKSFMRGKGIKTVQTVATLREDLLKDSEFEKVLFADLIITYSDYAKDKLNKLGFNNVKRIYPGIDLDIYSPSKKDKEMQKLLNVTDDDFVIQYPGEYARLGATDDLANLIINYVEEFRKRKIKVCFPGRIKGAADREKKKEIKKMLQYRNVLDLVRFSDEIKTRDIYEDDFMGRRYNTSDLIIFPVRDMKGKFDVPLAVAEAMACEKPVIVSDLPMLSEFAKPEHSVIIEPGSIKQLKNAILDLYDNPEKRIAIGKSARRFVTENFDIKKAAQNYREIYNGL